MWCENFMYDSVYNPIDTCHINKLEIWCENLMWSNGKSNLSIDFSTIIPNELNYVNRILGLDFTFDITAYILDIYHNLQEHYG